MKTNIIYKISFIFFSSIFFVACSPKNNNFDIDLSNLPRPKEIKDTNTETLISMKPENKVFIKELVTLKDREKIISEFKFGKNDPFTESEISLNQLSSNLQVNGFLNTESEKFVFVKYLGIEGKISEKSIGGVNTNLLPQGAKVKNIDTKNLKLTIDYENKNYMFEL